MTKPVKTGVIGVGRLGRHHTRLYNECNNGELVGVYDEDASAAQKVAEEMGTEVYSSLEALLPHVDALSLAVPTHKHFQMARHLLQNGKHVLIEKPITDNVSHAEELVRLASEEDLILSVGHVERYNPVLETLDKAPDPPRFVEAHRLASYPPSRPGVPPRGTEVSVILDLMIHDIDVVLAFAHAPLERVDAVGVPVLSTSHDIANARLQFEDGCVANLTSSRISADPMRKVRVFKSNVYFSLDYQNHSGEMAYISDNAVQREQVPVHETNPLKDELEDFCKCIQETKRTGVAPEPRVSGTQGLRALRVADKIISAIAKTS